MDRALTRISRYDWLILTSVNGVDALFTRMKRLSIPPNRLRGLKITAIGPATRRALESHKLRVHVMPREYVAEAVVGALRRRVKGQRVLLVRAAVARDVIPKELRKVGARVHVVAAYRTVAPRASAAKMQAALGGRRRPDFITFTSSSTARNFAAMVGGRGLAGTKLASIGPVTSATLREVGLRADVEAKTYTMAGLVRAIAKSV
jgi:uroporphyrinogen-III synthase